MIRVERPAEPEGFEEHVRRPGRAWLEVETHRSWPHARPYWNEWSPCRAALEDAFHGRCGYLAMSIPIGHVDHFESWASCREAGRHHLAYEWDNYRWLLPALNQSKQGLPCERLLDPFEIQDEWFELVLPSLELRLTEHVPAESRERAAYTLQRLKLDRGALALKQRQAWLERYMEGLSLERVLLEAPLVGRALRKLFDAPIASLSKELAIFSRRIETSRAAARHR